MTLSILRTSPTTQSLGFVTNDRQELIKKLVKKISERSVRLSLTLTLADMNILHLQQEREHQAVEKALDADEKFCLGIS